MPNAFARPPLGAPAHRRSFLFGTAAALLALNPALGQDSARKLKLVASFTILADFARAVAGERAEVTALVGLNADAHDFSPSPADAVAVAGASLVIVNGLGFDAFANRLVAAARPKPPVLIASKGIAAVKSGAGDKHDHDHDHGGEDPHAWQSIANAKIYIGAIRDALVGLDAEGAEIYRKNAATYLDQLSALEAETRAAFAGLPANRRLLVTTHDAFAYFARENGLTVRSLKGPKNGADVSAKEAAALIRDIRKLKAPAVFLENVSDQRLMDRIAKEAGAKIGGQLISDALTDAQGPAPTYIDMMKTNVKQVTTALTP